MIAQAERWRRWQLALGVDDEQNALSESDRRLNAALAALYGPRKAQGWAQRLRAARRKMAWRHSRVLPTTVIQIF